MKSSVQINNDVQTWLDGSKDYHDGLLLLLKYCKNRALTNYLTRKKNPGKLAYELGKLINLKVILRDKKLKITERVKISVDGKVRLEDLPESLQEYYRKNAGDYKLCRALHEKLKLLSGSSERADVRKQILELDDLIAERWSVIDRYVETGELPDIDDDSELEPGSELSGEVLTPQKVNALRTAISRHLVSLEKGVSDDKVVELKWKLQSAVNILTGGGHVLSDETVERLRGFDIVI